MTIKTICLVITIIIANLLFCGLAISVDTTKPQKKYLNILVLENNTVFGVTEQKTKDGKYIPIELKGEEKVKIVLYEFTMKDEVTIDILKSDKLQKGIIEILKAEKAVSVNLLNQWAQDKSTNNREKATYLLKVVTNTTN
jgi:hypothetical protein